jgi:hypothetical protein
MLKHSMGHSNGSKFVTIFGAVNRFFGNPNKRFTFFRFSGTRTNRTVSNPETDQLAGCQDASESRNRPLRVLPARLGIGYFGTRIAFFDHVSAATTGNPWGSGGNDSSFELV